jgi:hypothetical protein
MTWALVALGVWLELALDGQVVIIDDYSYWKVRRRLTSLSIGRFGQQWDEKKK